MHSLSQELGEASVDAPRMAVPSVVAGWWPRNTRDRAWPSRVSGSSRFTPKLAPSALCVRVSHSVSVGRYENSSAVSGAQTEDVSLSMPPRLAVQVEGEAVQVLAVEVLSVCVSLCVRAPVACK